MPTIAFVVAMRKNSSHTNRTTNIRYPNNFLKMNLSRNFVNRHWQCDNVTEKTRSESESVRRIQFILFDHFLRRFRLYIFFKKKFPVIYRNFGNFDEIEYYAPMTESNGTEFNFRLFVSSIYSNKRNRCTYIPHKAEKASVYYHTMCILQKKKSQWKSVEPGYLLKKGKQRVIFLYKNILYTVKVSVSFDS